MIAEVITPREQKLIEESGSGGGVATGIGTFIDEMILFSNQSHHHSQPTLPTPPPPPPPIQRNEKGEIDIFTQDDRKSLCSSTATKTTIPRISLPLPPPSSRAKSGVVAAAASLPAVAAAATSAAAVTAAVQNASLGSQVKASTETIWNELEVDDVSQTPPPSSSAEGGKKSKDEEFKRLNRLMFTKEDLELFEKVVSLRMRVSNDDVIRILCRTGRFRENGFPCHGCLSMLLNYDVPLANEISLSMESGGRCKECLTFKTKEEWDSISWVRLEWYTQTADGKMTADIFKSLLPSSPPCAITAPSVTCTASSKAATPLSSKLIQKAMDSLVNTVATELSSEKNLSLLAEKVKSKLESSEWVEKIVSLI